MLLNVTRVFWVLWPRCTFLAVLQKEKEFLPAGGFQPITGLGMNQQELPLGVKIPGATLYNCPAATTGIGKMCCSAAHRSELVHPKRWSSGAYV